MCATSPLTWASVWPILSDKTGFLLRANALQILELIIFGGLAAVVLFQLYSVLGRRVGRQADDNPTPIAVQRDRAPEATPLDAADAAEGLTGIAAVRAKDPSFDVSRFLSGARGAYEVVVRAFAAGDRETLRNILAPQVLDGFEQAITARETEGRTEQVEFLHTPRADLESADTRGDVASVVVRFLAEFRSRTKGPEGEAVDDRRTAELWTFERNVKSRDPNWTLVHVDAAEA